MYREHQAIMRVTGDCPLFNPREEERVLQLYQLSNSAYVWNVWPGYVDGEDCEVFMRQALLEAHWKAGGAGGDKEHVTQWIRANYPVTTVMPLHGGSPRKTSVDTVADLEYVRSLIERAA
jgi:spore coat polysaccharide biosynthesis protein SpsF (cytidylyltransferase family)